jgi:lysyl-tRNA synthetase class 2
MEGSGKALYPVTGRDGFLDLELLRERAEIIRRVRSFFDGRAYLEVDTPLLAPDLIPESCLEVFETRRVLPPEHPSRNREGSEGAPRGGINALPQGAFSQIKQRTPGAPRAQPCWLIPSPEIWMKKLIAAHRVNLYQICKCFRNGESSGALHSPEFTMLEYYTMNADYLDSLALTEALFAELLRGPGGSPADLAPPFERLSVAEAFARWAGFDLFEAARRKGGMEAEARRLGIDPVPGLGIAELYDLIFIHSVEPRLPGDHVVALTDYPAFVPCLAKKKRGPGNEAGGEADREAETFERWELYARGVELANCYSEETGAEEVRRFFESEAAAKEKTALVPHRHDRDYWKQFLSFPRCSGVALGLDRLIMALLGKSRMDMVLPFPME